MVNLLLYTTCALIWGSTWLVIQLQVHSQANPIWSVVYRFGISAILLLIYCQFKRLSLRFTYKQHGLIALQGGLIFSLAYSLFYVSSSYLISGFIAIIFSAVSLMNIINGRIFLGFPITKLILSASLLGMCGLMIIFFPQFKAELALHSISTHATVFAIIIGICATFFFSCGQMVIVKIKHLPLIPTTTLSMSYATLILVGIAMLQGAPLHFDYSPSYLWSLLYLSLCGTLIAFACYFSLVQRIGLARAGHLFIITPIIALLLSTHFEHFHWTGISFIGILLIFLSNALIIFNNSLTRS